MFPLLAVLNAAALDRSCAAVTAWVHEPAPGVQSLILTREEARRQDRTLRRLKRRFRAARQPEALQECLQAIAALPYQWPYMPWAHQALAGVADDAGVPAGLRRLAAVHAASLQMFFNVPEAFQFVVLMDAMSDDPVEELAAASSMARALHMPLWLNRSMSIEASGYWLEDTDRLGYGASFYYWQTNEYNLPYTLGRWLADAQEHASLPFDPVRFEILLIKVRALGMSPEAAPWLAEIAEAPPPIVAGMPAAQADLAQAVDAALAEIGSGEPRRTAPRPMPRQQPKVYAGVLADLGLLQRVEGDEREGDR